MSPSCLPGAVLGAASVIRAVPLLGELIMCVTCADRLRKPGPRCPGHSQAVGKGGPGGVTGSPQGRVHVQLYRGAEEQAVLLGPPVTGEREGGSHLGLQGRPWD